MLFRSILLAFLVIQLLGFQSVKAQCKAPATWFPHAMTPEPDFHKSIAPCEFHQWASIRLPSVRRITLCKGVT